jgi:hypothetical protein
MTNEIPEFVIPGFNIRVLQTFMQYPFAHHSSGSRYNGSDFLIHMNEFFGRSKVKNLNDRKELRMP